MQTVELIDNNKVIAVGVFFGNAEETICEIRAGTPLNNIVQTVERNGCKTITALAEKYFLWSSKEYLQNVVTTFPVRYSKYGSSLVLIESTDLYAKFEYTKSDGDNAIVTVEITPV